MTTDDRNAILLALDDHTQRVYLMLLEMGRDRFYSVEDVIDARVGLGDDISDYRARTILRHLARLGLVERGFVARGRTVHGFRAVGECIL